MPAVTLQPPSPLDEKSPRPHALSKEDSPSVGSQNPQKQLVMGSGEQVAGSEYPSPQPSPDSKRRQASIPYRSTSLKPMPTIPQRDSLSNATTSDSRDQYSTFDSVDTADTQASSLHTLPPLQAKAHNGFDLLEPVLEDDPACFDLVEPGEPVVSNAYSLETRGEQMFSREHLEYIFSDSSLLLGFTSFLSSQRPESIPILIYYLDALKAMRAIKYANAIAEALEPLAGHGFTVQTIPATQNRILETKASQAFDVLAQEYLPAFITDVFTRVVTTSIQKRITGTLPPHLREASEGLAEVFCLTDPSRPDNPIIMASEEFHRTTQYGVEYAIGRNCRFLQGPRTNQFSVKRLAQAIKAEKDHCETFVNYRRDGSPFMNLLMIAPLRDSRGVLRYFIGAQVDVSGLVKEGTDLEALQQMLSDQSKGKTSPDNNRKDEFQELSEMFNTTELETVRKHGGNMHREQVEDDASSILNRPRLLLKESNVHLNNEPRMPSRLNGKLSGIYSHYLLVRPYPSLRILFTSPSLRLPGILQSPFMDRIGSSSRVREELATALAEGRGVTAKVRWLLRSGDTGRNRWIHCTPLLGAHGRVGVWMIVLVNDETSPPARKFRPAPPVSNEIRKRGEGDINSPKRNGSMLSTISHPDTLNSRYQRLEGEPQLSEEDLDFNF